MLQKKNKRWFSNIFDECERNEQCITKIGKGDKNKPNLLYVI